MRGSLTTLRRPCRHPAGCHLHVQDKCAILSHVQGNRAIPVSPAPTPPPPNPAPAPALELHPTLLMLAWWGRAELDYQQLAAVLDKSHGCMASGLAGVPPDDRRPSGLGPAGSAPPSASPERHVLGPASGAVGARASNGSCGVASAAAAEASFNIEIRNVRLLQVLRWFADKTK
jgi:hypothetical protein